VLLVVKWLLFGFVCACIWLMASWRCRKWSGGYATRSTVARFAELWLWWTPCPNAQTIHHLTPHKSCENSYLCGTQHLVGCEIGCSKFLERFRKWCTQISTQLYLIFGIALFRLLRDYLLFSLTGFVGNWCLTIQTFLEMIADLMVSSRLSLKKSLTVVSYKILENKT